MLRFWRSSRLWQVLVACVFSLASTHAAAVTLKVGLSSEPTALDPYYHNLVSNLQITGHIFQALTASNSDMSLRPELAESYRKVNDTTWEFKLRKGVKFHDGSAFDANDVIFSFCRVPHVKGPGPLTGYTAPIAGMTAKDPHTLLITTKKPHPLLALELAIIQIVSDSLINGEKVTYVPDGGCKLSAEWPKTEDFNSGKAAIGTGPYGFGEYVKGDRITLKRNNAYWGKKPAWEAVLFRPIPSAGPRVAALLSNDVDVIENPPVDDALRFERKDSKHKVAVAPSLRVIYLDMDQRSDSIVPGDMKGTDGKNAFRDERVRRALSMAIDRRAIVSRIMKTYAVPAEQMIIKGCFGADPLMKPLPYDPDGAKELLAQAGYPNGFEITLAGPNDRYVKDAETMQAVAQMWARIGVKTKVNAMTKGVYFPKQAVNEFGVKLLGWGQFCDMSSPMRNTVATPNPEKGVGVFNQAGYSDPVLDQMIDRASSTMDDNDRLKLWRNASHRLMDKMGKIPLHHQVAAWALRKDLDYQARPDEVTYAFEIVPAK